MINQAVYTQPKLHGKAHRQISINQFRPMPKIYVTISRSYHNTTLKNSTYYTHIMAQIQPIEHGRQFDCQDTKTKCVDNLSINNKCPIISKRQSMQGEYITFCIYNNWGNNAITVSKKYFKENQSMEFSICTSLRDPFSNESFLYKLPLMLTWDLGHRMLRNSRVPSAQRNQHRILPHGNLQFFNYFTNP